MPASLIQYQEKAKDALLTKTILFDALTIIYCSNMLEVGAIIIERRLSRKRMEKFHFSRSTDKYFTKFLLMMLQYVQSNTAEYFAHSLI